MDRITYHDFDLKISAAGDQYIASVLHSPGGEGQITFTLPFSPIELENLILRMTRMRSARRKDSPEMEAARNLGSELFQSVFQGLVGKCLSKSQEKITEQTGLRIKLRLQDAPGLSELPWEFLFDSDEGRFLAQSVYTPIVRYLEFGGSLSPLKVALPLHVLGVVANPSDYRPPLNVKDEQQRLEAALDELIRANMVKITWLEQATLDGLRRVLRSGAYHVFHFIGHGGFDRRSERGMLVFTDETGRSQDVDAERLGVLLHDHRSLRLAVLNACEGARSTADDPFAGVAANLVRQGIPAVVAMQFEISDTSARAFAGEFYAALAQGYPVDAAQAEARKAVYCLPEDVEWGTPVLYLRSPDGVLFDVSEPPARVEKPPEPKPAVAVETPGEKAPAGKPLEVKQPVVEQSIVEQPAQSHVPAIPQEQPIAPDDSGKLLPSDLYTFVYLPQSKVWIGKYPVTNAQYKRFLDAPDFAEQEFWVDFPRYGVSPLSRIEGDSGMDGWKWLRGKVRYKKYSEDGKHLKPKRWHEPDFGVQRLDVPVVGINWYEANAYCRWLQAHWAECEESRQNPGFAQFKLRLPLESEWEEAAGGLNPLGRYGWDKNDKVTRSIYEITQRANILESKLGCTTPVNKYPLGVSHLGVWDLTGNVLEWQANFFDLQNVTLTLRGGSFSDNGWSVYVAAGRNGYLPDDREGISGFRLLCCPTQKKEAVIEELHKEKREKTVQSVVKPAAAETSHVQAQKQPPTSADPETVLPSDLCTFVYLSECKGWIGRYPVTNLQYQRFLESPDFAKQDFWMNFPKYGPPPDYAPLGNVGSEGWKWLQKALKNRGFSPDGKRVQPRRWRDENFGIQRPAVPVTGITWYEANAYGKWLIVNWKELPEARDNRTLTPREVRLPTEREWVAAAGGAQPKNRCPWDRKSQVTEEIEEIVRRANVEESGIGRPTPVGMYPLGQSPLGVWDLAGNTWEWQANYYDKNNEALSLRGGSFHSGAALARLSGRDLGPPLFSWNFNCIRVFVSSG